MLQLSYKIIICKYFIPFAKIDIFKIQIKFMII